MNTVALLASVVYVGRATECEEIFYKVDAEIDPTQNNQVAEIEIIDEMRFEFDVVIHSFPTGWANVFHCGSSDGVRQPGIWLHPESDTSGHQLEGFHISFSTVSNSNPWINPGPELVTDQEYNFVLEINQTQLTVIIDDTVVYDEPHNEHNTGLHPCYVSDPWWPAADVTLSNIVISGPGECQVDCSALDIDEFLGVCSDRYEDLVDDIESVAGLSSSITSNTQSIASNTQSISSNTQAIAALNSRIDGLTITDAQNVIPGGSMYEFDNKDLLLIGLAVINLITVFVAVYICTSSAKARQYHPVKAIYSSDDENRQFK